MILPFALGIYKNCVLAEICYAFILLPYSLKIHNFIGYSHPNMFTRES